STALTSPVDSPRAEHVHPLGHDDGGSCGFSPLRYLVSTVPSKLIPTLTVSPAISGAQANDTAAQTSSVRIRRIGYLKRIEPTLGREMATPAYANEQCRPSAM